MKIAFFSAKELNIGSMKCSIHKSGKLGFNDAARKQLGLEVGKYILIGQNTESNDSDLYMLPTNEYSEEAFRVNKNGGYYNINTKGLFDRLKYDYINPTKTIMFDLLEVEIEGTKFYRMQKREIERKNEDNSEELIYDK